MSIDRSVAADSVLFDLRDRPERRRKIVEARRLLLAGAIGEPTTVRMKFIGGGSGGWSVDDRAWGWRIEEAAAGRGMATFDHGFHLFSTAQYLLGPAESVMGRIDRRKAGEHDCPAVALLAHAGGKLTTIEWAMV